MPSLVWNTTEEPSVSRTEATTLPSLDTLNDGALLSMFSKSMGDERETAFAELVRRHSGLVLGHCRRRLKDTASAEDAAQAVFVLLARKASSLQREGSLAGWLYRTSELVARNMKRARRTRTKHETADRGTPLVTPPNVSVENMKLLRQLLDDALLQLNEKDRESILLHYLQGLSQQEAADRIGITYAAYRQRLGRALDTLRNFTGSRGAVFSVGSLGVALAALGQADQASAAVLHSTFTQAALGKLALSSSVQGLVNGVLKQMLLKKVGLLGGVLTLLLLSLSFTLMGADVKTAAGTQPVPPPKPKAEVAPPAPVASTAGAVTLANVKGVGRAVFSPDGKWVAVREDGNKLALIEVEQALKNPTYQPQRFDLPPAAPLDVYGDQFIGEPAVFSPDSSTVLFAAKDGLMSAKRPYKEAAQAVAGVSGWLAPVLGTGNENVTAFLKVLRPAARGGRGNDDVSARVQLMLLKNSAGKEALIDGPIVRARDVAWAPSKKELWVTLEDGAAAVVDLKGAVVKKFETALLKNLINKDFGEVRVKALTPDGKFILEGERGYPPEMKNMEGVYVPRGDEAPERGRNPGSAERGPDMPSYLFLADGEKLTKLRNDSAARFIDTLWVLPAVKGDQFLYFQVANNGGAGHGTPNVWLGTVDQMGKRTDIDLKNPFTPEVDAPRFQLLELAPDASKAIVFMMGQRIRRIPNKLDGEMKKELEQQIASGQIKGAAHGGPEALMQMFSSSMLFRKYERLGGSYDNGDLHMTFFTWQVMEIDTQKKSLRSLTPEYGEAIGKLENTVGAPGAPDRYTMNHCAYSPSGSCMAVCLRGMRTAMAPGPTEEPRGLMLIPVAAK